MDFAMIKSQDFTIPMPSVWVLYFSFTCIYSTNIIELIAYLLNEISTGKWVTHDEAYASPHFASNAGRNVPSAKKGMTTSQSKSVENKVNKHDNGPLPGPVVRASLNPMRNAKAAPSSLSVGKRKRPNERSKVISEEEKEALKAREAARKRVEQREKPLLGLYSKPY